MPNHANDASAATLAPVPIGVPPRIWRRVCLFLDPAAHHWGRVELDVADSHVTGARLIESLPLQASRE